MDLGYIFKSQPKSTYQQFTAFDKNCKVGGQNKCRFLMNLSVNANSIMYEQLQLCIESIVVFLIKCFTVSMHHPSPFVLPPMFATKARSKEL